MDGNVRKIPGRFPLFGSAAHAPMPAPRHAVKICNTWRLTAGDSSSNPLDNKQNHLRRGGSGESLGQSSLCLSMFELEVLLWVLSV